jgi:uncharacterized protein YlaI
MKLKCEICKTFTYLDKHHIQSKSCGGSNKAHNIAKICPNCHRKVHKGDVKLEGKFMTCNGYQLIWSENELITGRKPDVFVF